MSKPCVAIMATCDTKGIEASYLKARLIEQDVDVLVVDTGILRDPVEIVPDISKHEVAAKGGHTIEEAIATGSRGDAVEMMQDGLNKIIPELYYNGRIDGLIALGGAEGSVLAATAMEALPLGVPKLVVSAIASGRHKFNEIVHNNDAMVLHSIIDIVGINSISRTIFDNAVCAVAGMVKCRVKNKIEEENKKRIGVTILGTVTPPVQNFLMPAFEKEGYEVISFHANGVGGDCMDKLIDEGYFDASIEYCISELVALHLGGFHVSSENRLDASMKAGIPTIVTPGCADLVALGRMETLTEDQKNRKLYKHNPEIMLIRVNNEEMRQIATTVAEKMNKCVDPSKVKLLVPTRGYCTQDIEGKPLYDHESDMVFLETMKEKLIKDIEIIVVDAHINDKEFSDVTIETMLSMLE